MERCEREPCCAAGDAWRRRTAPHAGCTTPTTPCVTQSTRLAVGGDDVASLERHKVAGHQLAHRHLAPAPVAAHHGLRRRQVLRRGGRGVGA